MLRLIKNDAAFAESVIRYERGPVIACPLFSSPVSCGFPSPAEDYQEGTLDLNDLLIRHPSATFFLRVQGDSMRGAGILSGDLVIVDRSLEARHDDVVVASVDGELTLKRFTVVKGRIYLAPENEAYPTIEITEEMETVIWGVVTHAIHKVQ